MDQQDMSLFDVNFKFQFLNEQFQLGNIFRLPGMVAIRMRPSFEFIGVDYDNRHKHRDKISSHLRREGYYHNLFIDAYVKK